MRYSVTCDREFQWYGTLNVAAFLSFFSFFLSATLPFGVFTRRNIQIEFLGVIVHDSYYLQRRSYVVLRLAARRPPAACMSHLRVFFFFFFVALLSIFVSSPLVTCGPCFNTQQLNNTTPE